MNRYNLQVDDKNERHKNLNTAPARQHKHKDGHNRVNLGLGIAGGVCFAAGLACGLVSLFGLKVEHAQLSYPTIPSESKIEGTYSKLTGLPLADGALVDAPAFCVQTPNGLDGARPQAGLNKAGVIFEAIAEAGITRFAAIYQDRTSAVIGPIRSLRLYYLQWDTPFDCTIVHAGGADDALAAVRSGGYKDLTENYAYMYRGTYGSRLWNNLFTTSSNLKRFAADYGYNTSNINGFARMTPEESRRSRIDNLVSERLNITTPTSTNTSNLSAKVSSINVNFGGWADYNVSYSYNADTNSYSRSYASGSSHDVYNCPDQDLGEVNPENSCELVQMSPSVVVAMVVQEQRASDNYHEDITTIGSGTAYVFQNGTATAGTWHKDSVGDQIHFTDEAGKEIKLAPGQTIVSAVPTYGSVDF